MSFDTKFEEKKTVCNFLLKRLQQQYVFPNTISVKIYKIMKQYYKHLIYTRSYSISSRIWQRLDFDPVSKTPVENLFQTG